MSAIIVEIPDVTALVLAVKDVLVQRVLLAIHNLVTKGNHVMFAKKVSISDICLVLTFIWSKVFK